MAPLKAAPEAVAGSLSDYTKLEGSSWVTNKRDTRPILRAKNGYASIEPKTISQQLKECVFDGGRLNEPMIGAEWPEPALGADGVAPPPLPLSKWKFWTYQEAFNDIQKAAKGYIALGHQRYDTVSILAANAPYWFLGAYGSMYAGGINNGMYPTDTPDQLIYKVKNSGTSIVHVDTLANLKKFEDILNETPSIKAFVVWKEEPTAKQLTREDGSVAKVLTWDELMELGSDNSLNEELEARVADQKPEECCCLVFTSGTTGLPKAVMISHDNLVFTGSGVQEYMPKKSLGRVQTRILSYLPLSHIAGFLVDIISPLAFHNFSKGYVTVHFARSYDLKSGSILFRLQTVHPTIFFGVPRVWEKISEKLKAKGAEVKGFKKKLSTFAKKKGLQASRNQQLGGSGKSGHFIAKKVLGKIHKALGLDEVGLALSGAAPMSKETLEYWGSLGIQVKEGYGMSESTGFATCGSDKAQQWGSVGYVAPGTELKIFKVNPDNITDKTECPKADGFENVGEEFQGELCFRGRNIMMGYLSNPDLGEEHVKLIEKKNKDAIDEEGWLHSGDKGFITKKGMVKITGRYKEIIIGAGGENITPVPIEDDLKARCPALSNVMMVGDNRKFNTALFTLKCEGATGEKPGSNILEGPAAQVVPGVTTVEEACASEEYIAYLEKALKETNANGKVIFNNAFKIQKFTILPRDFSVETDELTATLKLKRSVVDKKYKDAIDAMYESSSVFVPFK